VIRSSQSSRWGCYVRSCSNNRLFLRTI